VADLHRRSGNFRSAYDFTVESACADVLKSMSKRRAAARVVETRLGACRRLWAEFKAAHELVLSGKGNVYEVERLSKEYAVARRAYATEVKSKDPS
jgi:hypothetical protein